MVFFFVFFNLSYVFIYMDISITGGSKHTPESLIKFLDENQIHTGMRKSTIDCKAIEDKIRLSYNDIGWVSAEIRGTRLIIKITETNMPAPAQKAQEPSHIIASKDAIIKSIITQTGEPKVKPGDIVKKGDILVSGVLEIMDDFDEIINKKPVIANASIRCKSYYDYKDSFSMDYIEKKFTGKTKKSYYLSFSDKKLFLYNPRYSYDNYDIIIDEVKIHITDTFYLPFRYGSLKAIEFEKSCKKYTKDQAIEIAKARLYRYIEKLIEKDVSIIENNVTISIIDNRCVTQGRIIVEEPAWEYKKVDKGEWRMEQTDELDRNDN